MARFLHYLRRFALSGRHASVGVGTILSLSVASCDKVAYVRILGSDLTRDDADLVVAKIQVEAAEKGGGNVGPYCVSIHYGPIGYIFVNDQINYAGELDFVEQCGVDLSDGDQRFYNLTSHLVLDANLPARVQVRQGSVFEIMEGVFTPPK